MKNVSSIVLAIALFATRECTTSAQEWTRFRGPNGTGIAPGKSIPTIIKDESIRWKIELPGTGHSSPVLWGDRLFVTTTGDKAGGISVLCFNGNTGKQLWQTDFPLKPFARHEFNSFASSTPAVDADRIYVAWNEPEHFYLTALDHSGKKIWQRDFGPFVSQHGCGISPIVFDGKVILGNEQDDQKLVKEHPRSGESFIVAVDAKTGKTVWQTPRNSAVVAYSTPCVVTRGNTTEVIFASQGHGIYAVAPGTGKILWEYDKAFDKRSVSSPMLAGDVILGSCGSGGGGNYVTAIKINNTSQGPKPELAYQMKKSAPYVPTGIVIGPLAWLWSDAGIVTCLQVKTGEIRYQERVGGDFFGSPVCQNGRLFCVSTTGEIIVLEASDKFNVLHRYSLQELCRSTPAIALNQMFIHTEKHLFSIGGRGEQPSP